MMLLKIAAHELERIIAHCLPLFALVLSPLPLALVLDALVFQSFASSSSWGLRRKNWSTNESLQECTIVI
jgi:hypothetical protein